MIGMAVPSFEEETARLLAEGETPEQVALLWVALDPTAEIADEPDDVDDPCWDHSEWRAS